MTNYYTKIKFEMPKDPGEPTPAKPGLKFDAEKLKEAVNRIRQEFEKIRTGQSNLCTYAIDPRNFSFPAGNRLTMLEENPNQENFDGFIQIAKQDLGYRAAVAFTGWLLESLEKTYE